VINIYYMYILNRKVYPYKPKYLLSRLKLFQRK